MDGQLPSTRLVNSKINYRYPLFPCTRGEEIPEQKTIRIYDFKLLKPEERKPVLQIGKSEREPRLSNPRFSPYERSVKTELNEPLTISKTTTVSISHPYSVFNRDLINKSLSIVNGERIYVDEIETPEGVKFKEIKEEKSEEN